MNEYEQAVLARLDEIAKTLDRLLLLTLSDHDAIHRTTTAKKALRALDRSTTCATR